MTSPTMTDIAAQLASIYKAQRGAQVELSHQEADLAARILAITPAEGWPGKNETERKTSRDKAIAADETCAKIEAEISQLRDDIADFAGEVDALTEQRDAMRWTIRAELVQALAQRNLPPAPIHTAIEDTAEAVSDNAVFDELPF